MTDLTHEQADAITTAINYDAQIAVLEKQPGTWLKAVRGFAKTELKRLGKLQPQRQNMICNAVESQLFADNELPSNYTGFKNYILALREFVETDQRDAPEDSAWQAFDPTKSHVIYCYRVAKEKTYYRIFSRVTHTNFVIDDPQIIDQLDAIKPIKHLKHNQMVNTDCEVTWRYQLIEGTHDHRQIVVKVEKSVLSADEKLLIQDMIAYITEQHRDDKTPRALIEVTANIPDNIADRALLESLYRRGWVWKTNQTNIPLAWGITELATREAGITMANTTDDIMFVSKEHERLCKLADLLYPPGMNDAYHLALILKATTSDHLRDHGKDATLSVLKDFFNPLIATATNRKLEAAKDMTFDEPVDLNTEFPRDESDVPPVSEGKMLSESKSYFAEITAMLKGRGLEAKTEVFRTRIQGGESASKIPIAKRDELLNTLEFILNDEYPNADSWKAWLNMNHVSKDIETPALLAKMGVQKLSEYKGTLAQAYELLYQIRQNTQQSNDEATPRDEPKIDRMVSERTETPRIERSSAASPVHKSEGSQNHMDDIQIKNTHFESPVCVYPHDHGVIIYHGVKYVVTTREGATPSMVLDMLKSWDEMISSGVFEIAQAGRVEAITAAVAAPTVPQLSIVPQPGIFTAPVPQPVASASPNGGTYNIVAIKKVMDEGKTRYELYKDANDQSPVLTVRVVAIVNNILAKHIQVDALQPGTRYAVSWKASWTPSSKINPHNNLPFKDLASIEAA